jgi:hypothetical protein
MNRNYDPMLAQLAATIIAGIDLLDSERTLRHKAETAVQVAEMILDECDWVRECEEVDAACEVHVDQAKRTPID